MNRLFLGMVLMLVFHLPLQADKQSRKNAEGNRLYQKRDYSGALEKYVEAQAGKKYKRELAYNTGNTLYQQGKYQEALREYEKALGPEKDSFSKQVYFNRGNASFRSGDFQKSAESFQKTLELDPSDMEAKHNLELALRNLQPSPQPPPSQNREDRQKEQPQQPKGQDPKEGRKNQQQDQSKSSPPQGQNEPKPAGDSKGKLNSAEAQRMLDAFENQEKQEQRKQAMKLQRRRSSGRDW